MRAAAWAAAIGALLVASPLPAQRSDATHPPATVESLLADHFATVAMTFVSGNQELNDDRLTASRILLDAALELSPDDAELWRLRREHARTMADTEAERKALREYCRLRPSDDVAQVDLILMTLETQDTIEERAGTIERLLAGEVGKRLSPALRSRLASYVAVSARERGNTPLFQSWLKYALRTDPTNVAAARLTYDLILERNAPPYEIAVALYGMLRANPMSASTHQRLGELLLAYGVYDRAADQFETTQLLAGEPGSPGFYQSWAIALAAQGQSAEALELIRSYEAVLNMQAQQPAPADNAAAADPSATAPAPTPATVDLPVELEMLRLCIQGGIDTPAAVPVERMRAALQKQIDAGDRSARARLAWVLVWFNHDTQAARALVDELAAEQSEKSPGIRRLRGWLALHAGDRAAAQDFLSPVANEDVFAAYGMARLMQSTDRAQSNRWRRMTIQLQPNSLAAMLAARELNEAREKAEDTEIGIGLKQMMRTWPALIVRPDPQRRPWMALDISVEQQRAGYLDPVIAKVTLRNLTDIPLSFAPEGAVPTQVFIYISARQTGKSMGTLPPIVVDMHRRLRLEANESLTVEVPLHRGHFGLLLQQLAGQSIGFTATAILDPRTTPRGQVISGLLGATATQGLVEVGGAAPSRPQIDRWLAALDQPDRTARARALANMVRLGPALLQVEGTAEPAQRMIRSVNDRFANLDPVTQAWMLLFLPAAPADGPAPDSADAMFSLVHQSAVRSDSVPVRLAYLIAHVNKADSPHITAAMRHDDPRISIFARIKRQFIMDAAATENASK